ncbi:hypothetical protein [Leucobacter sp. W1038]
MRDPQASTAALRADDDVIQRAAPFAADRARSAGVDGSAAR